MAVNVCLGGYATVHQVTVYLEPLAEIAASNEDGRF